MTNEYKSETLFYITSEKEYMSKQFKRLVDNGNSNERLQYKYNSDMLDNYLSSYQAKIVLSKKNAKRKQYILRANAIQKKNEMRFKYYDMHHPDLYLD